MGINTFCGTLSCILWTILNKRDFSVMAALICLCKIFPSLFRLTTRLDFVNSQPHVMPNQPKNIILLTIHRSIIRYIGPATGLLGNFGGVYVITKARVGIYISFKTKEFECGTSCVKNGGSKSSSRGLLARCYDLTTLWTVLVYTHIARLHMTLSSVRYGFLPALISKSSTLLKARS